VRFTFVDSFAAGRDGAVARRSTEPGSLRGGDEGYNAGAAHRVMHMPRTDVHTASRDIRARFAEARGGGMDRAPGPLLGLRPAAFAAFSSS